MNELELLKPVSRSFYLSIRLLPRALREPVALAYLLARTSDTIADSNAVTAEKRIELLDRFARAIAGKDQSIGKALKELLLSKQDRSQSSSRSRGTRPRQDLSSGITEGEKALLDSAEAILRALKNLSPGDQRDIRELLAVITRGQRHCMNTLIWWPVAWANFGRVFVFAKYRVSPHGSKRTCSSWEPIMAGGCSW